MRLTWTAQCLACTTIASSTLLNTVSADTPGRVSCSAIGLCCMQLSWGLTGDHGTALKPLCARRC